MSKLNVTISLDLGDTPTISKHCDHNDGSTSWAVTADDGTFYFWGTKTQMKALADAILHIIETETEMTV